MSKRSKNLADQLFPIEDENIEVSVIDIPPEKRRLITETYDFSIATLHDYLKNGSIFIPEYQRKYVWNRSQASRLIESLIIQCPIPVIYLHQEKDERLAVIDGNQRLTSIRLFLEDEYTLRGLTAYPELEGLSFSELDPRLKRHIHNRTLRCITIQKETHPQIKFDVFERINTGAVQLNPQEVRHGVFHGTLMDLIDDLAKEKIWKEISGIKTDSRMKGSELILRFFALNIDAKEYKKPLSGFLNKFSEKYHSISDTTKLEWKNTFLSTLESINSIYGKNAFRVIGSDLKPSAKNLNAALFDAQMLSIAYINPTKEQIKSLAKRKFMRDLYQLINEDKFNESIVSGTSAKSSVNYRIKRYKEFVQQQFS